MLEKRRRLIVAASLMTAALAGACTGSKPSEPPAATPRPSTLAWIGCGDGFECATLRVPLDFAAPASGKMIELALIRLPASQPENHIGSLLVNPGGPGGSGVTFVRDSATDVFSPEVRNRFDIVGFDPRGVGASVPPVHCIDDPEPYIAAENAPNDEQGVNARKTAAVSFAQACAQRVGEILPFLSAVRVAHDMDLIREAVGDEKLTYIGFSYGTLLGATYAEIYPASVRALVLDGALDPSIGPREHSAAQDSAFDDEFSKFMITCAESESCPFHSEGAPGDALSELIDRMDEQALPATSARDSRTVDAGVLWSAVDAALYDKEHGWPALAQALAVADKEGDGSLLLKLMDSYYERSDTGAYTNQFQAGIAIRCVDAPRDFVRTPTPPPTMKPSLRATPTSTPSPSIRPDASGRTSPCDVWPVPPDRTPGPLTARDAPPILVIGTTGDPATPYWEARSLAGQLRSGRLLTFDGEGHTGYGGKSECIDKAVDDYLIRLKVPDYGRTCH